MNFICSGVLILGGSKQSSDMIGFQSYIDSLRGGVHADIDNESYYYKQLLKNILYSDVQFNCPAPDPRLSGESNIDLLVDAHSGEQNGSIIVVQHGTKFGKSDIIIGVLALKLKNNDHSFMVVDSKTEDNKIKRNNCMLFHNKTKVERKLRDTIITTYISIESSTYYFYELHCVFVFYR